MIFVSKYVIPSGYCAIALFPFIIVKRPDLKEDKVLINHERIHLRQQLELLILPFYVIYLVEFTINYINCKNWSAAYRQISFEREASINEKNPEYLMDRRLWTFVNYYNFKKAQ